jgi:hypothetical protein
MLTATLADPCLLFAKKFNPSTGIFLEVSVKTNDHALVAAYSSMSVHFPAVGTLNVVDFVPSAGEFTLFGLGNNVIVTVDSSRGNTPNEYDATVRCVLEGLQLH